MKTKLLILATIIILAALFIYLTFTMSAQGQLNSMIALLSEGHQKDSMFASREKTGMLRVAASCGMSSRSRMADFNDMKVTMDCHDSNQVIIHVDSFKGVPMIDMKAIWKLPK
jgi:transketolase N-terminal domain/subunit